VQTLVDDLMTVLAPHADALGCRDALETVTQLVRESGADEQRRIYAEGGSLPALVERLASDFCAPAAAAL
jgi:gamma-glutamyl:cysteine ligase YbdK (ATP-grasp superfamily)